MSETFQKVTALVAGDEVRVSDHGYAKLSADDIFVGEVIEGVQNGEVVEDYPDHMRGPCVLVLQNDRQGEPIHVLWGIAQGVERPAVLITVYRPDPTRWSGDFRTRVK